MMRPSRRMQAAELSALTRCLLIQHTAAATKIAALSKRHLICDGHGVPLAIQLTGANRNDSQQALALVDAIPHLQGKRGRPRHSPVCVVGDRGYAAEPIRHGLRIRGIRPWLAKRNTEHGSGLGRWRWVVERTFAWLNQFRRLRVRYANSVYK